MADQIIWSKDTPTSYDELLLTKGRYVLTFDTTLVPDLIIPRDIPKKSLTLAGKTVQLVSYHPETGEKGGIDRVIITIEVFENPLPLIAVIAGLGIIATFLLHSVARVSEAIGNSPIIWVILIGLVLYGVAQFRGGT